jgi:hypothetical protein
MQPRKVSDRQIHLLELVRSRVAEQGYLIFELAKRLRRHPKEFVAARKGDLRQFVLVRAKGDGVHVEPFYSRSAYSEIRKIVERYGALGISWGTQIGLQRKQLGLTNFISPGGERRLKKLGLEEKTPPR